MSCENFKDLQLLDDPFPAPNGRIPLRDGRSLETLSRKASLALTVCGRYRGSAHFLSRGGEVPGVVVRASPDNEIEHSNLMAR
jgi:hypothetical protein